MKCASTSMTITTGEGELKKQFDVPALVHPLIPGLAVVMYPFGQFGVTHVTSGLALSGTSERMGTALQVMAEAAILGAKYGIDWLENAETLIPRIVAEHYEKPVPFDRYYSGTGENRTPYKVGQWITAIRTDIDEFPWESFSESPEGVAQALLDEFEVLVTGSAPKE